MRISKLDVARLPVAALMLAVYLPVAATVLLVHAVVDLIEA